MPIKPENRALYPANWRQISREAKERSRWHCQHPECLARQYEFGFWKEAAGGDAHWCRLGAGGTYTEARRAAAERSFAMHGHGPAHTKVIVIVLTVAHLNHDPTDCREVNLRVMCQRHHLAHDHHHHRVNAQATRRSRSGVAELF